MRKKSVFLLFLFCVFLFIPPSYADDQIIFDAEWEDLKKYSRSVIYNHTARLASLAEEGHKDDSIDLNQADILSDMYKTDLYREEYRDYLVSHENAHLLITYAGHLQLAELCGLVSPDERSTEKERLIKNLEARGVTQKQKLFSLYLYMASFNIHENMGDQIEFECDEDDKKQLSEDLEYYRKENFRLVD